MFYKISSPLLTLSASLLLSTSLSASNVFDLPSFTSSQGFQIQGAAAIDQAGYSVAQAGDINGDGIQDIIIGAQGADPNSRTDAGAAYIVYGKSGGYASPIDLNSLTSTQGFQIQGAAASDLTGISVSQAGDINNDGIQDVIIGAQGADPNGRAGAGAAYVIYGQSGGYASPIDLNSLTSAQGFQIQGAAAGDNTGVSVSQAGDINKDGIQDVIVGGIAAAPNGRSNAGAAYVIYGKSGGYATPIDLNSLTSAQGFQIQGATSGDFTGVSVNQAGDINGDGTQDVIIGASFSSPNSKNRAGRAYVIYGKSGGYASPIDLNSLTSTQGFQIQGATTLDYTGQSVSKAGDFNNDGIQDIIIGAYLADPNSQTDAGTAYVIYGKSGGYTSPIDLTSLTSTQGFPIQGAQGGDHTGISVGLIGDINGDGLQDVIIGADTASPNTRSSAGVAYVVYGKTGGYTSLDLNSLTVVQGFKVQGTTANDDTGRSVNPAGDINNDGIQDIVVGAPFARPNSRSLAGVAYVIYGQAPFSTSSPSASATPSVSPTSSVTPSITSSPSATPTVTPSITPSSSPSATSSITPSPSVTPSITPSISMSSSVSPSISPTPSISRSASPSPLQAPASSDSNTLTSWYAKAWSAVRSLWSGSPAQEESIYTFESYLADCKVAHARPNSQDRFLNQLKTWEAQGKLDFERDFEADFAQGFKIPDSSQWKAAQEFVKAYEEAAEEDTFDAQRDWTSVSFGKPVTVVTPSVSRPSLPYEGEGMLGY